jgi:hypothetical protein
VLHRSPGLEARVAPHQVAPAVRVVPVAIGLPHLEAHLVAGGGKVVQSHLVQRHGHDGGFEGVRGSVDFRARHGRDLSAGHRLTHDEQVGQTGPQGIAHAFIGDGHPAGTVQQRQPLLFRLLPLLGPIVLAQGGHVGQVAAIGPHQPGGAPLARLEVPDQRDGLWPWRTTVGGQRVGVGAQAEQEHAVGAVAPAGQQHVGGPACRLDPAPIFAPCGRFAPQYNLMRLPVLVDHLHADQGRRDRAQHLQADGGQRVLVAVVQGRQEPVQSRPATLGQRLAVKLRRDVDVPWGGGSDERGQRVAGQVVVGPSHAQPALLEIQERAVAGVGASHGQPMRRRKGVGEIHPGR